MKRYTKPLLIAGATAAAGLTMLSATAIHAASSTTSSATDPMSSLVTALAQKFNLNTSDVQQVFDDQKAQMDEQRQADFEEQLTQAVTDGKITEAQKTLIIAKAAEEKTFMDSLKDKTKEERDAAMKTHMDELKQWVSDNNIPDQFARFGLGGRGGPHGPHGAGPDGEDEAPPADDSTGDSSSSSSTSN